MNLYRTDFYRAEDSNLETKNNSDEVTDFLDIVLINPVYGELNLNKIKLEVDGGNRKYKEVFFSEASLLSDKVAQASLQLSNYAVSLNQISERYPNGLFTATTDPSLLSKFANGTTTTMVRDSNGKLVEHAGFKEITNVNNINPATVLSAGMQVLSAVSGTYYLHQINSKIAELDVKLEELISIHHDANIGRLLAGRKSLSEISEREYVDKIDVITIREFKKTADEIYEEYYYRLKRKEEKVLGKTNNWTKTKLREDVNYSLMVAFEASKLSLYAQLIEILTRMKIGSQPEILKGLIAQLKRNYEKSMYVNIFKELEKLVKSRQMKSQQDLDAHKDELMERLLNMLNVKYIISPYDKETNGIMTLKKISDVLATKARIKLENTSAQKSAEQITKIKNTNQIDLIIHDVIYNRLNEEQELIYVFVNGEQRVYIPSSNET